MAPAAARERIRLSARRGLHHPLKGRLPRCCLHHPLAQRRHHVRAHSGGQAGSAFRAPRRRAGDQRLPARDGRHTALRLRPAKDAGGRLHAQRGHHRRRRERDAQHPPLRGQPPPARAAQAGAHLSGQRAARGHHADGALRGLYDRQAAQLALPDAAGCAGSRPLPAGRLPRALRRHPQHGQDHRRPAGDHRQPLPRSGAGARLPLRGGAHAALRAVSRPAAALPPRALPPRPGQRQTAGGHRHVPRRVPRLPAPPRRPRRHPARARRRAQPPRGGRPPARGDEHRARRQRARHRQRRGRGRGRPAHRMASAHGHRIERAALRVRAPVHQPRPAGDARRHAPEHAGPADDLRRAGLRQCDARALHSGKLHQRTAAA